MVWFKAIWIITNCPPIICGQDLFMTSNGEGPYYKSVPHRYNSSEIIRHSCLSVLNKLFQPMKHVLLISLSALAKFIFAVFIEIFVVLFFTVAKQVLNKMSVYLSTLHSSWCLKSCFHDCFVQKRKTHKLKMAVNFLQMFHEFHFPLCQEEGENEFPSDHLWQKQ